MMEDPHELLLELCRHDFTAFLRKAWPWVSGGELLEWNWHFDAIAYKLEQISEGDVRRSLINLPPRNGKSKTVSICWVAWMLGQDPTKNFVCVSYSSELSPRELAVRFTDTKGYFVSESSVYRLLKAHDLISSSAFIVMRSVIRRRPSINSGRQTLPTSKSSVGVGCICRPSWMTSRATSSAESCARR